MTRSGLLADLEGYEHLLFEPMTQGDLDGLYALYGAWVALLGGSSEAVSLCDALDTFIEVGIEEGDTEQAYLDWSRARRTLVALGPVRLDGCQPVPR